MTAVSATAGPAAGPAGLRLSRVKLTLPPPIPGEIERTRLLDELAASEAPLSWIAAPAGYGKSVLVSQLARRLREERGAGVGWVSLDAADSDPARFWAYVVAGTAAAGVPAAAGLLDELATRPEATADVVAGWRTAIEAASDGPVVLVLDDLHEVDRDQPLRQLGDVLLRPPPLLRLVVTARRDVALPTARLRSRGRLAEVGPADLALDLAETSAVLCRGRSQASADTEAGTGRPVQADAEALHARTEGWPVAVGLVSRLLDGGSGTGDLLDRTGASGAALADYLASEILASQPTGRRDFLLAVSVAPMLTAELCDHVRSRTDSARLLEECATADVLVSRADDEHHCYRIHPLLREHLHDRLVGCDPGLAATLHERAGDWFRAAGQLDQAVRQYVAAGRGDLARDIVRSHWLALANEHGTYQLVDLVDLIDADLGDPAVPAGRTTADPGVRDAATTGAAAGVGAEGEGGVGAEAEPAEDPGLLLAMFAGWALLNRGAYDEVDRRLSGALDRVAGTPDEDFVRLHAETLRSHVARHRGDPSAAAEHGAAAVLAAATWRAGPGRADPNADLHEGAAVTAHGVALTWTSPAAARCVLQRARALAAAGQDRSCAVMSAGHLALLAVDTGDLATARSLAGGVLAETADPAEERFHKPAVAHLALALADVADGHPRRALAVLDTACRLAESGREPALQVRVHAGRALALHLLGRREEMNAALRHARSRLDELPGPLEAPARAALREQLVAAAAHCRFAPRDGRHLPTSARVLSDREAVVLRLLGRGLSRREVADELVVSENTIKTQLTSIRRKLDAPGRTDLVAHARTLGLLGD